MRAAIIENGTVVNIAEADEAFAAEQGWIVTDDAQIGWSYNGGVFAAPPPPVITIEQEREGMVCSRRQGKLAIGPEIWAQVEALASQPDTPWGLKVAVYDTQEWRRTDEDMAALIWAMNLTDEQADDLFRLAVTL